MAPHMPSAQKIISVPRSEISGLGLFMNPIELAIKQTIRIRPIAIRAGLGNGGSISLCMVYVRGFILPNVRGDTRLPPARLMREHQA